MKNIFLIIFATNLFAHISAHTFPYEQKLKDLIEGELTLSPYDELTGCRLTEIYQVGSVAIVNATCGIDEDMGFSHRDVSYETIINLNDFEIISFKEKDYHWTKQPSHLLTLIEKKLKHYTWSDGKECGRGCYISIRTIRRLENSFSTEVIRAKLNDNRNYEYRHLKVTGTIKNKSINNISYREF